MEIRVYRAPGYKGLKAMHDRFAGPEIPILYRCAIHPVLNTSALAGYWHPNPIYFIPFASLDRQEKACAAFASDPEWIRVRQESIESDGHLNSFMKIALYRVEI
jgi:hypothetical protein